MKYLINVHHIAWSLLLLALVISHPSYTQENEMQNDNIIQLHLIELAQELRLQNEVTTSAITTYSHTSDIRWLERYEDAANQFNTNLSQIKRIYRNEGLSYIQLIDGFNESVIALEQRAIKLVLSGELQDAQLRLDSVDYVENAQQRKYAINAFIESLETSLSQSLVPPKNELNSLY